jgi:hypothetical protein
MPGMPDSLWIRLAELPVLIESYGLEPVTTPVRLIGGGAAGLEENVSPLEGEANTLHTLGPLAGALTLAVWAPDRRGPVAGAARQPA